MKILLPVDDSTRTQRLLDYMAAHEETFGPRHEYSVLTVVAPIPARVAILLSRSKMDDCYREDAQKALQPVRAFLEDKGWPVNATFAVGHASSVIAECARSGKYGLMVMGTHGRSALGGLVLGSVTTGVLSRCKLPVLLVP